MTGPDRAAVERPTDGVTAWLDDAGRRAAPLAALRRVEGAPTLLGVSGHILTVATHGQDAG